MQRSIKIHEKCPICSDFFSIDSDFTLKQGALTNILVKPHEKCGEFIIIVDNEGKLKGTLVVEKKDIQTNSVQQYTDILDFNDSSILFYYIQHISREKNPKGTLVTTDPKYNLFAHGEFFNRWLENFSDAKKDFAIMTTQEIILTSITINKEIRITYGFNLEKMIEKNIPINSMDAALKWLKELCQNLSKKIMV